LLDKRSSVLIRPFHLGDISPKEVVREALPTKLLSQVVDVLLDLAHGDEAAFRGHQMFNDNPKPPTL